jgi:hypothetical protein
MHAFQSCKVGPAIFRGLSQFYVFSLPHRCSVPDVIFSDRFFSNFSARHAPHRGSTPRRSMRAIAQCALRTRSIEKGNLLNHMVVIAIAAGIARAIEAFEFLLIAGEVIDEAMHSFLATVLLGFTIL